MLRVSQISNCRLNWRGNMQKSDPIRNINELTAFKNYYLHIKPNPRNYLLIIFGLNTALRISDLLNIKWGDIFENNGKIKRHLQITETKTKKHKTIYLNNNIVYAIQNYSTENHNNNHYLFSHTNNKEIKITRVQAFRIIKEASSYCHLDGIISCHSLRKTFGYHARIQGADPAVLVDIFNHSSYEVTKRYLGIDQDDQDDIYKNIII